MTVSTRPAPHACDEEYSLPCAEALMAGTLALMTGYAQSGDAQRDALRGKIVANLQSLSALPTLTPHFRTMLANLGERWAGAVPAMQPAERERRLWHAAPDALQ
jgi:hypothetical protein